MLTDLACAKTKPTEKLRKLSDMFGLQLWIFPNGSKLWRLAYRFSGRQKLLALGRYPETTLQKARIGAEEARARVRAGADPSHERKLERLAREHPDASFKTLCTEYIDKLTKEGRSEATLEKTQWLLDFAIPVLGLKAVDEIKPIDVLSVLRGVEARGRYDTARRLRSTIGAVCRYGIATARGMTDPTAVLQGALIAPKAKSRAAITDPKKLGSLMRAVDEFDGQKTTQAALKLMALLFPRPGELRLAEWTEFDLEQRIWTIPAARTKMRRPHVIPLSRQALDVLAALRPVSGTSRFILPGVRSMLTPLSEVTMNAALRRMGYTTDEMTPHGFRASASTLLNESGLWNADAIERQLAHVDTDEVRRAYARGEHWDERVRMMAWWANYLDDLREVAAPITFANAERVEIVTRH